LAAGGARGAELPRIREAEAGADRGGHEVDDRDRSLKVDNGDLAEGRVVSVR
jgi:hypothetical protein